MLKAKQLAQRMSAKLNRQFIQLQQLGAQIDIALNASDWEAAVLINAERQQLLTAIFTESGQRLDQGRISFLQQLALQTQQQQLRLQEQQEKLVDQLSGINYNKHAVDCYQSHHTA